MFLNNGSTKRNAAFLSEISFSRSEEFLVLWFKAILLLHIDRFPRVKRTTRNTNHKVLIHIECYESINLFLYTCQTSFILLWIIICV